MRALADGVWQLTGFPRDAVNVYILDDVLIDAGTALDRRRIERQLADRVIGAHALTHAHPDHYGSSHALCARFAIPLWCGAGDVAAVESGKVVGPGGRMLASPTRS